jgi:hypothetical protein
VTASLALSHSRLPKEVTLPSLPVRYDESVMRVLLDAYPAPVSDEEVGMEIGDGVQAEAVLEQFIAQSIVHRAGGLFWLTRAARRTALLAEAASAYDE